MKKAVWVVGVVGVLLAGCSNGAGKIEASDNAALPSGTRASQSLETERIPKASTRNETSVKSVTTSDSLTHDSFVMPNVVGSNLQTAQDKLQSLGSYVLDQQDASGEGRLQLVDSNWKVCRQKPAAGARVSSDSVVTLAAVKLNEKCS